MTVFRSFRRQVSVEKRRPAPLVLAALWVLSFGFHAAAEDRPLPDLPPWFTAAAPVGWEFSPASLLAYEDHRLFTYAAARGVPADAAVVAAADARRPMRFVRRYVQLGENIGLIDDALVSAEGNATVAWRIPAPEPPSAAGQAIEITVGEQRLRYRVLLAEGASFQGATTLGRGNSLMEMRSAEAGGPLRVIHLLYPAGERAEDAPQAAATIAEGVVRVAIRWGDRSAEIELPPLRQGAGALEISDAAGQALLPRRVLPSGILPHGPAGMQLLERWDSRYRGDTLPGWDTGRPSSELREAVAEGVVRPGRAVELGCGAGTNAIFLAEQGFDVTAIDIAPTALRLAARRAEAAEVRVRWMLADVTRPPRMPPFDFVYDRGCYHGVRQSDAAGYVAALKQLTRPGSQVLIMAGNANEPGGGGPPRVREEDIRRDFAEGFEIVSLTERRFDTRERDAAGALGWVILLRRTE